MLRRKLGKGDAKDDEQKTILEAKHDASNFALRVASCFAGSGNIERSLPPMSIRFSLRKLPLKAPANVNKLKRNPPFKS